MKVSIVIPNYNGKEIMRKLLPKVMRILPEHEVIVVDDFSTDGSREMLVETFPNVRILLKDKHEGFASSVNFGVNNASYDLILLLNHDVYPENNILEYLIPYFDEDQVFAVGCLERSQEKNGLVLRGRGVGIFYKGFLQHERGEVDKFSTLWVSGGSALFRKSIWLKLGGMSGIYNPFYWEDIDLSYRAVKSGYKILFEPRSIVCHLHDEGAIRKEFNESEVMTTAYRNQILFVWINITDLKYILSHIANLPLHLYRSLITDRLFIKGIIWALTRLGQAIRLRNSNQKLFQIMDKQVLDIFKSEFSSE